MPKTSQSKKNQKWLSAAATVLVVVAVVGIIALLCNFAFGGKEEHYTTTTPDTTIRYLACESASPSDPFFVAERVMGAEHEVKVIYKNDTVGKLFYTYDGEFATPADATAAEGDLHADYNIYTGSSAEVLEPSFGIINDGNELKISLVVDTGDLTSGLARLFFITPEEYAALGDEITVSELQSLYQSKGFQCELGD